MSEDLPFKSDLKDDILRRRRDYFIKDVKAPLMESLIKSTRRVNFFSYISLFIDVFRMLRAVNRYPEPTKENSDKTNVHVIIDFWDDFERWNTSRVELFRVARRVSLAEIQHDDWYAERHDKYLYEMTKAIQEGRYILPIVHSPTTHWSDPEAIKELAIARMKYATEEMG